MDFDVEIFIAGAAGPDTPDWRRRLVIEADRHADIVLRRRLRVRNVEADPSEGIDPGRSLGVAGDIGLALLAIVEIA